MVIQGMSSSSGTALGDIQWERKSVCILGLIMPRGCLTSFKSPKKCLNLFKDLLSSLSWQLAVLMFSPRCWEAAGGNSGPMPSPANRELPFSHFPISQADSRDWKLKCHCQPQTSSTENLGLTGRENEKLLGSGAV